MVPVQGPRATLPGGGEAGLDSYGLFRGRIYDRIRANVA
jgi:hypothetical protein